MQFAELRIRNLQAFDELKAFNDTGKFLFKHPLIIHFSLQQNLKKLLKTNHSQFLKEHALALDNIKRYQSYLNNKKATEKQKEGYKENLEKHQQKAQLMEMILGDNI